MKDIIKSVKDFKIIPENFKSAGKFELIDIDEKVMKIKLILLDEKELNDYKVNSNVEIFGVNNKGLIYFETKIISCDRDIIELATTTDYSIIQRREYSRVALKQGNIIFKDLGQNVVDDILDISAGGACLKTIQPLEIDKIYDIQIDLSNNMSIECSLKPIRVEKDNDKYVVSGKFVNLENMDRIVLVQYTFKIKLEEQDKEDI